LEEAVGGQVHRSVEGPIGWLKLDNPERLNAISADMWRGLAAGVTEFQQDSAVRCIVVTGCGDKAFASGADISEFESQRSDPRGVAEYEEMAMASLGAVARARKPIVAMLRGWCIGGGLALALSCDLRFAAENTRFSIPAARLGLGYEYPSVAKLVSIVGAANARYMLFSGERFDAERALRMNVVHEVVPTELLTERVAALTATLAENAPLTIATAKLAVETALADSHTRDIAAVEAAVRGCYESADYKEGQRAFAEKRKPVFTGR
jgi:enoyl-CoA hydratase